MREVRHSPISQKCFFLIISGKNRDNIIFTYKCVGIILKEKLKQSCKSNYKTEKYSLHVAKK